MMAANINRAGVNNTSRMACVNTIIKAMLNTKKDALKVCHFNSCSIFPKIRAVRDLFHKTNIHIICVSETWLRAVHTSNMVHIEGYNLVRHDRNVPGVQRGGGVAIYVKYGIPYKIVCRSSMDSSIEYLFIELQLKKDTILIGCVYKPPRCMPWKPLEDVLANLSPQYGDTIITGDFNTDILTTSKRTDDFLDMLKDNNLRVVNDQIPTHYKAITKPSCLDLMCTNSLAKVTMCDQLDIPSISHHNLIVITYKLRKECQQQKHDKHYRDFKHVNMDALIIDFYKQPWYSIRSCLSADAQVELLNQFISDLFEQHVPLKRFKEKNNFAVSKTLANICMERDLAHRVWRKYRKPQDGEKFIKFRDEAKVMEEHELRNHYKSQFASSLNTAELWRNINNLGHKETAKQKPIFTSTELNEHYSEKCDAPTLQINSTFKQSETEFALSNVTKEDVAKSIMSIKSKAVGTDGISPVFVKLILPHLLEHITYIFNTILTTSQFPSMWKCARIVPIAKTGAPEKPADYRPISILPFLSKAFERVVQTQLHSHLNSRSLLSPCQSGFRRGHSTTTALINISEDIRDGFENKKESILLLLDFSKAFDSVNHRILVRKLNELFDLSATACRLMMSYLTSRSQYVCQEADVSSIGFVTKGVPQGSVLGPLLFTLYINEICPRSSKV